MIKFNEENCISIIQQIINEQRHEIVYGIVNSKLVLISEMKNINEENARLLGYDIKSGLHNGGILVLNKGDFEIGYFGEYGNSFLNDFIQAMLVFLSSKNLNAEYIDNDLLVNGYKVLGCSNRCWYNIMYTGIHIAMNVKIEDIQAICTKPMKKIPKGLYDFGITTEEIEELFFSVVNKNTN